MSDELTRIKQLRDEVRNFVDERDWNKYHHPKELAISIVIEAAELLEMFQWDEKVDIQDIKDDEKTMGKIKEEVADVMTYILCLANQLDLDLSEVVLAKLEKNRAKYDKNTVLETGAYRKDKL
ncbi:nucleotide pyrophosphohydrolase [Candidatus Poribacteria bacterium]